MNPKIHEGRRSAVARGNDPRAIGFGDGQLWVANTSDGTVSRVEKDGSVSATVTVGQAPRGVAADNSGIWISNGDSDSVSVIDPGTNTASQTVRLASGADPKGSAISAGRVWIATRGTGRVSPINDEDARGWNRRSRSATSPATSPLAAGELTSRAATGASTDHPASESPTGKPIVTPRDLPKGSSPENASSGYGEIWVADGGNNTVIPLTTV